MRRLLPPTLTVTLMPALNRAVSFAKSSDTRYARIVLPLVAWLVVGFVPLVSLDAVGGQTAVEVVRYVSFRGIDRDAWYAVAPVFVAAAALSGLTLLLGMVLESVGLVFKDRALTIWGCGVILVSLVVMIVSTQPVASTTLFGIAAFPHAGSWLLLALVAPTLWRMRVVELPSWRHTGKPGVN